MKLFAPKYYRDFACIADKCRHSCCIGWEIDIDSDTLKKYAVLDCGYADVIRESIDRAGAPHFRMDADGRCAHLDSRGLCRIISNIGDCALCEICSEHPRFYHTAGGVREVGLGLCCEEAGRIILSSDGYDKFVEIGEVDGEENCDFDAVACRGAVYLILSDRELPYADRLRSIYNKYGFRFGCFGEEWRDVLESLEYLEDEHRGLICDFSADFTDRCEEELERVLAYFIYRHCSPAEDEAEFKIGLGFSLFCERLFASMIKKYADVPPTELVRILSEEIEYSEDNCEAIKTEIMFM